MKNQDYIIFECAGDTNKNILATAVIASIKKTYSIKKIIVVTEHPEVYLHNPNVYRVYKFGNLSYFYDDYVKDKESLIFRHDPEATSDFIYKKKDTIDIWCDIYKIERRNSVPALYFTWREK